MTQPDPKEISGTLYRVNQLGKASEQMFSRIYRAFGRQKEVERTQQIVALNDARELVIKQRDEEIQRLGGILATIQQGVIMQDNEIKAHSWAWRGERQQLIVDGWESKDPNIDSEVLSSLMELMGDRLCGQSYDKYKLTDVMIGLSGDNLKPHEYFPEAKDTAKRFACEWYFPGDCQWLVKRIETPPHAPLEKPRLEPR